MLLAIGKHNNVPNPLRSFVYVPGILPNALHMLSHLIFPATPLRIHHFPYFTH